jgi:hypothetical protein
LPPGQITPNGAVIFGAILIGATMATAGLHGLAILAAFTAVFAIIEVRSGAMTALGRSILLVLPLAAFMLIVWVGIVGRAPAEIASGAPGTRTAAALHVALISSRLFIIVVAIQLIAARFAQMSPLAFICALRIPLTLKRLLVFTLSLIETFRHAVDRAHTALIASGLLSRRTSIRNLGNSWVLVQTIWLSAITIVVGRLRDKWPIEKTLTLLDHALSRGALSSLSRADLIWLPIVIGASALAIGTR